LDFFGGQGNHLFFSLKRSLTEYYNILNYKFFIFTFFIFGLLLIIILNYLYSLKIECSSEEAKVNIYFINNYLNGII
jgi:hypothetical protein